MMADSNFFVKYCECQELIKIWGYVIVMDTYKLIPEIITEIETSEHGQPKLIIYFSENSDKESREIAMRDFFDFVA